MSRKISYQFPFASYPAVRLMLFLITGIVAGKYLPFSLLQLSIFAGVVLLAWILSEFLIRKWKLTLSVRLATVAYLLFITLTGAFWIKTDQADKKRAYESVQYLDLLAWEELVIDGTVEQTGYTTSGKHVFVVDVNQTQFEGDLKREDAYKVRIYSEVEEGEKIRPGNQISAKIRLYEFPERRNPHEFDYGEWLYQQGIFAHGEMHEILEIEDLETGFSWIPLREYVQRNIEMVYSEEVAPMAKALLLGYKEEISEDTTQNFSRSGLSHIMAVSGLHVGFVVAPFWFMIPWFWTKRWGKYIGLILLTILLIGYAGLTGFSASVCRASLMAWLITYGKLFYKVRNSVNLTAGAAVILLIWNPNQLFDVGFQLSFSAVFVILLVLPEAQRLIPAKHRYGKAGALYSLILISIVVQAGLFPILTYYFGEFSIAGPIANALVIPVLTFAVPWGLFLSVIPAQSIQVAGVGVIPIEWSLQWVEQVANYIGGSDWSYFSVTTGSVTIFLLWISIILFLSSIRIPQLRWKLLAVSLVFLNLLMVSLIIDEMKQPSAKITFLDVGQGDAVHVETPEGKHLLIDAGRWIPGRNSGEQTILPYFKSLGVHKIDALILSHPHADHIGGVKSLIDEMEIEHIYQSDYEYDSQLYRDFMSMALKHKIPITNVFAGDLIETDENMRIYVIGPEIREYQPSNPNNYSVSIKIQYGESSVLFTGDAEKGQEQRMAEVYGEFLKADLYKMGHHGSRTSSSTKLLEVMQPEISVASLAYQNRFSHPNREAITQVSRFSRENYFTSLDGAIVFESDGNTFRKREWNQKR